MDSTENMSNALINIAVESWRVSKLFENLLSKLDAGDQSKYRNQFRWFIKKVEESLKDAEMHIVNVEGQSFDTGMAATALNLEEFNEDDRLIVDQMIEPIIMGPEGVLKTGTVMLRSVKQ